MPRFKNKSSFPTDMDESAGGECASRTVVTEEATGQGADLTVRLFAIPSVEEDVPVQRVAFVPKGKNNLAVAAFEKSSFMKALVTECGFVARNVGFSHSYLNTMGMF